MRGIRLKPLGDGIHSIVLPGLDCTYSPWYEDNDFVATLEAVKNNTLVDIYRCWELWALVKQLSSSGGHVLEVGVWKGGSGCLMARSAQLANPETRVYLCDTFTGVPKATEMDSQYKGGEHQDASIEVVQKLADDLGVKNIVILQGIFPEDTAHLIADQTISVCHIDVDVYASAKDVFNWVWPRLCVGGAVVFSDYGCMACDGVMRFVNEIVPVKGGLMIHNLNGNAVVIKTGT